MIRDKVIPSVLVSVLLLALARDATAASVPHTFSAGTVASAAEVNANFAALVEAVSALEAKVDPQSMEALAGTYDYFEIAIDADKISNSSTSIAGLATSGTVVLNANGTGHANLSGSYRQLAFDEVFATENDRSVELNFLITPETVDEDLTWTYSNGVLTVPDAGSFVVVGRLLVQSTVNSEGKNGIVILTRR